MESIKFCMSFALLVLYSTPRTAATTCQTIKDALPEAPSGKYITSSKSGIPYEIYCEMGLNGGGYTFLPPYALSFLTNDEISSFFTNRTSFLLRARIENGTQPYAVLSQLSEYQQIPLMIGLNNHTGYNPPNNTDIIGKPYLYFGFLPISEASKNSVQGLEVNGVRVTFTNCNKDPNSQITLFSNMREVQPSSYNVPGPFCQQFLSNYKLNPSGRVMPPEYFLFAETHWGGCGCYMQTNQIPELLGVTIGFR